MKQQETAVHVNMGYLVPIILAATLGGLLFGYDTGVISGAIEPLTSKFSLSPVMKGWVSGCVLLGGALGVLIVGPLSDRYGRRKALLLAALLFILSSIGTAIPPTITIFVLFRFLGGLGIGIASMSTPMFIAEISPAHLRGRMVVINQIAIVSGLTVVYFANYGIAQLGDQVWLNETGWRWMFASGMIPSTLFFILILRIPESPRWMIEVAREQEAVNILARIGGSDYAGNELINIRRSILEEKGTWAEVFSRAMRVPLTLGIALAILQQVTGINVFMYFGTTIFRNIGQSTGVDAGMLQQSIVGVAGILFTVIAVLTVDRWGRKPLMILGSTGMLLSLLGMGSMAQWMIDPVEAAGGMLALIILYLGCYSLSAGPVIWVILSEIYPTRIRGRALGLATFALWLADFAVTQTFPMMDKNEPLAERFNHAFPFYVYAIFCLVLLMVLRFVPETKGKTLEEIERTWKRRYNKPEY